MMMMNKASFSEFRSKVEQQLALENESRALGADRYRAARPQPWRDAASSTVKDESDLPPGRQLIKQVVPPVAQAIDEFIERVANGGAGRRPAAVRLLAQVDDAEVAAYLSVRTVVNAAAQGLTIQQTAHEIADALVHQIEMSNFKRVNKKGYKGLLKAQSGAQSFSSKKRDALRDMMAKEGAKITSSQIDRLHAGTKMIDLICELTGLFVAEASWADKGQIIIRPTEAARDWFERQHARCELLEPIHLPMVVKPRKWSSPFRGGYLTRQSHGRMVKQWAGPYHEELRHIDMPEVYKALNGVQEVAWKINRPVLDVMRTVWDQGGSLGGLPRRDDLPLPPKPHNISEDEDALKEWKAKAAAVYGQNGQLLSRRISISQKLWIADKFAHEDAIYFPHDLDFRGRIYPLPVGGPHPQSDDAGKALLHFSKGLPLGPDGGYWLCIHIANLFGVDKVSFRDRIDWTMAHAEQLLDSAKDPLDGNRFWTTADSPYCALAACMEFSGYIRDGADHISHIPVALDGSNSGLQHFSAMLRDPVGAAAVNLTPQEKPADVYMQVARLAQELIDDGYHVDPPKMPEGIADDPVKAAQFINDWYKGRDAWRDGKISRKIAKRPTMTYCYSATRFGMQAMILQTLHETDRERQTEGLPPYLGDADLYKAASYLSHVMWKAISEVVCAASDAMKWLRDAAKVASKDGLPIWWTTPMGMPVLQIYRNHETSRVAVHYGGKLMKVTLRAPTEEISPTAQANGIAPNFVHSNDAAHLQAVVVRCIETGVPDLALIHDSFGAHPSCCQALADNLRDTFVEQYTPDRLAMFRDELAEQIGPELAALLPPLPTLGSLDLNKVRESDYVFA